MAQVLTCAEFYPDAGTGFEDCAVTAWVEQDISAFPALTIADAQQISASVGLLLITAWIFKAVRRAVLSVSNDHQPSE